MWPFYFLEKIILCNESFVMVWVEQEILSWLKDLERELELEFLYYDLDDLLLVEIRSKTQRANQSIGVYITSLKGMFLESHESLLERRKQKLFGRISFFCTIVLALARQLEAVGGCACPSAQL